MLEKLQVCMLGGFSIETQECRIDDSDTRSQKPWLLIAYLMHHRDRTVTQEELFRVCWGDEEQKDDPANALRVVLHRARAILDKLGILRGSELIIRSRDGFRWNDRVPIIIDAEEFERLCEAALGEMDTKKRLEYICRAVKIYRGRFLDRCAGEKWVRDVGKHLRALYISAALEGIELLGADGRWEETVTVCREVLLVEPYQEQVSRYLMSGLSALGRNREAEEVYEQLRSTYLTKVGRLPEEETSQLYYSIVRNLSPGAVPALLERSDEENDRMEIRARVCDFNSFRMFYASVERLIIQCGFELYLVLFTVETESDRPVSKRTMERGMEQLTQQLQKGLNLGAAISRCADNQFLLMIRGDGYEGACQVCERHVETFYRSHPHSLLRLNYRIWRVGGEPEEK